MVLWESLVGDSRYHWYPVNPEDSSTKRNSAFGNGGRTTQRGRGGRIGDVSAELGIDFAGIEGEKLPSGFLNTMAIIESGGDPNARTIIQVLAGLFQQIDSNAAAYGWLIGLTLCSLLKVL